MSPATVIILFLAILYGQHKMVESKTIVDSILWLGFSIGMSLWASVELGIL